MTNFADALAQMKRTPPLPTSFENIYLRQQSLSSLAIIQQLAENKVDENPGMGYAEVVTLLENISELLFDVVCGDDGEKFADIPDAATLEARFPDEVKMQLLQETMAALGNSSLRGAGIISGTKSIYSTAELPLS